MNIIKGLLNKEFGQIKQTQNKQQKTLKLHTDNIQKIKTSLEKSLKQLKNTIKDKTEDFQNMKDTMENMDTTLKSFKEIKQNQNNMISNVHTTQQSIEAQKITFEQSLKQINNKINEKAKDFKNIINFARNDIQKQVSIVKAESKTLEHNLELKLDQMLISCTESRKQITFKETSIQTENSVGSIQTNSKIMDFASHLDIHKIVVQPKNCEYEVLDIVDENFTGDGWDEVIKAKVKCNGIISEMLMSKEFATIKHDDGTETYCKWFGNADD
eukprot:167531_1